MNSQQDVSPSPGASELSSGVQSSPPSGDRETGGACQTGTGGCGCGLIWIGIAVIAAATFVAFSPGLHNEFLYWDDDLNVINNPHFRGLWPANLRWMFYTTHTGPYQPLSWVTLAADYMVWGLKPMGYHLTSLLLHIGAAVALFFLTRRLVRLALRLRVGEREGLITLSATIAALMFAVHPLRVESVAWVTERRDVLSGLFFFLTLLAYVKARSPVPDSAESRGQSLASTFVFFALAVLSKGTTLVLPILMLLLDVFPLQRLTGGIRGWFSKASREVWWEKVPFLVVAAFAGAMAIRGQEQAGALVSLAERGPVDRIAVALYGPAFYVYKTLVPLSLSPLYEWPVEFSPVAWQFLLSTVVVIGVTALAIRFCREWVAGLVLWLAYLVMLSPVLLPFQAGVQLAADRYTYLACGVWAILAAGAVAWLGAGGKVREVGKVCDRCGRVPQGDSSHCPECGIEFSPRLERVELRSGMGPALGVAVVCYVAIALLVLLTSRQVRVWRDTSSLWTHVMNYNPDTWHAYAGLGAEMERRKDYAKALEYWEKAQQIFPDSADLQNNMGSVLVRMDQPIDAIEHYRKAIRLNPNLAAAHYNLGSILAKQNDRLGEAVDHYLEAIKLAPGFADAHFNLANTYFRMGKYKEASDHYQLTLGYDPQNAKALEMYRKVENLRLQSGR